MSGKASTGSERMWLIMRKMTCFTVGDLEQLAEVPYPTAYKFLYILEKAGYLKKEMRKGGPGGRRGGIKWQLMKDTGPKAPRLDQIYVVKDSNTGESVTVGADHE
ncbi:MAG: hypothetical protein WAN11_17785 [Syntrophobacteraceae bacterium]